MLDVVLCVSLLSAFGMLVYSWKTNVAPRKKKKTESEPRITFYDDENYSKKAPKYESNFGCLDNNVSGAVRYNRSMYYNANAFNKYKEQVLNQNIPI